MTTNDGGAAFPNIVRGAIAEYQVCEGGMSLRDYFAAAALTGLLQRGTIDDMSLLSEKAWHVADFMLVERVVVR